MTDTGAMPDGDRPRHTRPRSATGAAAPAGRTVTPHAGHTLTLPVAGTMGAR